MTTTPDTPDTPRLSMQTYFDVTVRYLRNQRTRAVASGPNGAQCVYLTPDGNVCALGLWLPEGHPAQRFFGGAEAVYRNHPELLGTAFSDERAVTVAEFPPGVVLASQLQRIHDNTRFRCQDLGGGGVNSQGEEALAKIARQSGLNHRHPRATEQEDADV